MKYRLVELLQCPRCRADLEVSEMEHTVASGGVGPVFRCRRFCARERRSTIPEWETCTECGRTEIWSGWLACLGCGQKFRIVESVPWLFDEQAHGADRRLTDTAALYSHLWDNGKDNCPGSSHIEGVEAALEEPVVRGDIGLDAGSGRGADTAVVGRRHPQVEIISVDLSEGVYRTKRAAEGLSNVHVVRGSVLEMPVRSDVCDFVYSFGVLHHTANPLQGLREIARVLKVPGRAALYLYESHSDNPWKALPLKGVAMLRAFTVKLGPPVLSGLCYVLSPLVVLLFSVPARAMRRFARTRRLAERMPFNFGTSPFSVHGDLMDRFGAPIEIRYNREEVLALLGKSGLTEIKTTKLKAAAGWVVLGAKDGGLKGSEAT